MPRQARLDAPGVLHPITSRVIKRGKTFLEARAREDFRECIFRISPQTGTAFCAWVSVPNSAQHLFRTGTVFLPPITGKFLTVYALRISQHRKRRGQLFQNRCKSIVCQEDACLKEIVRYIRLTFVCAGIVRTITKLKILSYRGVSRLMSKPERARQGVRYVLGDFG